MRQHVYLPAVGLYIAGSMHFLPLLVFAPHRGVADGSPMIAVVKDGVAGKVDQYMGAGTWFEGFAGRVWAGAEAAPQIRRKWAGAAERMAIQVAAACCLSAGSFRRSSPGCGRGGSASPGELRSAARPDASVHSLNGRLLMTSVELFRTVSRARPNFWPPRAHSSCRQ